MPVRNLLYQHRGLVAVVVNENSPNVWLCGWERGNRLWWGVELNLPTRELALQSWNETVANHARANDRA